MFDADEISRLLTRLATDLTAAGHSAELFLVGGAAMAVAYDRDRDHTVRSVQLRQRG